MTETLGEQPDGYLPVEKLRRQYLEFSKVKLDEITEQRNARHYYHCDQWTSKQTKELTKRKQPIVTYNRIARKIDGVVGLVERLRQDAKAYPRTPQHEQGADIASATLRYALDTAKWDAVSSECARVCAINGMAGVEFNIVKGDHGDPEVSLDVIEVDTFFYDPRSFRPDFSDARFMGVARWLDLDTAIEMFPDKEEELSGLIDSGGDIESNQQQDRESKWIDADLKRLRVVEHWYKHRGTWCYCFYVSNTTLVEGRSPFVDEKGKSQSKYEMFSSAVDHDGDRYGFFRNLKSPQDELNQRRAKALHQLNTRRIIARAGTLANPEKTRQEAARPDGLIEWQTEKPEFDDQRSLADMTGQLEFAKDAATEIENFGPNPALVGQGIESKSGRAIQLLQQAGIAELGPYIIALRDWKIRVYRRMWNAIQQNWTAERWIRVTDNDGLAQFIKVNQLTGEFGTPQIVNALGSLDVDIIVDEGPDGINAMTDAYDTMLALAQQGVQVPPQVIIKLSQLPSDIKKEVLDMLEQASQPTPQQVREQQIKTAGAVAEVDKIKSETAKNMATAQKTATEAELAPAEFHASVVDRAMKAAQQPVGYT